MNKGQLPRVGIGGWLIAVSTILVFLGFGIQLAEGQPLTRNYLVAIPGWSAIALSYTWKRIGKSPLLGFLFGLIGGAALWYCGVLLAAAIRGLSR